MITPAFHISIFFFFNDTATTEIYTLSLHDALPISRPNNAIAWCTVRWMPATNAVDRKSTRLNSSHRTISYAVFCLKKKKKIYELRCGRQPKGQTKQDGDGCDNG